MKNLVVILDPAHGDNVKGKCSPDGSHKEYIWSRIRIESIRSMLVNMGYEVYQTTYSKHEPGLSARKEYASSICKGKRKLLLSLHNNAYGSDGKWHSAQGASVFTTKGVTDSDRCAKIILDRLASDFPDIKIRRYMNSALNEDFEENFTVLSGSGYMACLIEWLFQDNIYDCKKLTDKEFNRRFEIAIVNAIEDISNYFH